MKELVLVPIGGLANRVYAITSAMALCKCNEIKLKVIWFKDYTMGARFNALFKLSNMTDSVEIIDAHWYHYIYDRPRKHNLWVSYFFQWLLFKKRSYEKDMFVAFTPEKLIKDFERLDRIYLVHCSRFYPHESFNDLILQDDIIEKVAAVASLFLNLDVIGVHIRRTDNIRSIKKSPLNLFIEKMDQEIAIDPNVKFYVASDSFKEKMKLKDRYGNRIITSLKEAERNSEEGIKEALVELCILSKTKKIYGSAHSTFSELAAQISGIDLVILSIDDCE